MTGAKLARANLPARVWIEWRPVPVRPWCVMSERGALMCAFTAAACERWLARYGYALKDPTGARAEGDTGPSYARADTFPTNPPEA